MLKKIKNKVYNKEREIFLRETTTKKQSGAI